MMHGVVVVDETPAMAAKVPMPDARICVEYLVVNPGRQKDINVAVLGAL